MNSTRAAGFLAGLVSCFALVGCLGTEDGNVDVADDTINTAPASLEEAHAEMDKIDRIMEKSGSTPELIEMQLQIRDLIDTYSGLVDRIEVAPGHSINFFATSDGSVVMNERMNAGDQSAVQRGTEEPIEALYARLAPGRAVPAALQNLRGIQAGDLAASPNAEVSVQEGSLGSAPQSAANGVATEQSALTDSAEDGLWFVANHCNLQPPGTVLGRGTCVIDKVGGRYSQGVSDHSEASVAFTRGSGSIYVRLRAVAGGPIDAEWRMLRGEVFTLWAWAPWKTVRDSGCLPRPFACGTHRESQDRTFRWSVEDPGSRKYNMSTIYYTNRQSWNGP